MPFLADVNICTGCSACACLCPAHCIEMINDDKGFSYLNTFAFISVREKTGARIVKELIGRDVPVLVDPVMMLTKQEWLLTAKKPRMICKRPYVFKYFLGEKNEDVDKWANNNGFASYEMMDNNNPRLYCSGPGEFLTLINNAELIYSDSFHCIAFSIIFRKPFIVSARKGNYNYMTSRLETLLEKFGLQNRWDYLVSESEDLNCDFSGADE